MAEDPFKPLVTFSEPKDEKPRIEPLPVFTNVVGLVPTFTTIPTGQARKLSEQVRLYVSGSTVRLYVYDTRNNVWRFFDASTGVTTDFKGRWDFDFESNADAKPTGTTTGASAIDEVGSGLQHRQTGAGAAGTSVVYSLADNGNGFDMYANDPIFFTAVAYTSGAASSGHQYLFTMGNTQSLTSGAFDFTLRHIGFKIVHNGSAYALYATQADGTTESATQLTTVAEDDNLELFALHTSDTSTDFYYRKNGSALSSATTISTNYPASTFDNSACSWLSTNNGNTAELLRSISYSGYYER